MPARPGKPARIRAFLALRADISTALQPLIQRLEEIAADPNSKLRPSPPDNLHITLKFLGPIAESKLAQLSDIARQVAARHSPLQLRCRGMGVFRGSLWVGVDADAALADLARDLNGAAELLGSPAEDKPFVPHITVARYGRSADFGLQSLLEEFRDHDWGTLSLGEFHLYQSQTLAEGARYTIIGSYSLSPATQSEEPQQDPQAPAD